MAQFGQDHVTLTIPGRATPQERHHAGITIVELAGWPTTPTAQTEARHVLDVLGILEPLRADRSTS